MLRIRSIVPAGLLYLYLLPAALAQFQPTTCKNAFTPEQEIAEGQKAAAQVYKTMPVLPDGNPVVQYVQQIGAKLVAQAPLMPGVDRQWPFNYHVVASADINAFALPGGSIFINLGTIQAAQTEAQLAGVMAHETSHVIMRHSTCNLTKQQHRSVLFGIGSLASAILLGDGAAGALAQGVVGFGQNLDFLHMSRDDEKQADLLGTQLLYDAGYDPRGLPQFFEIIQAKYGRGGSQMLSDHPNPGNRTEYVDAEIASLPHRAHYIVTTPEFTRMHALAMHETAFSAKEIQAGTWKQAGSYASGPGGGISRASTNIAQQLPPASSGDAGANPPSPTPGSLHRLTPAQLGLNAPMRSLQAALYAVSYPSTWQQTGSLNGQVTLAPPGGADASGVAYGVLINLAKQSGSGVSDPASLNAATDALVQQLSQQNTGLAQTGRSSTLVLNGRQAESVELRGASPIVQGAAALPEQDWLVTVARPDGDLNYLVFVSPEPDFASIKPLFSAILESFQAQ